MADDGGDKTLRGRDLAGLGGLLAGAVIGGLVLGLLVDDATGSSPLYSLIGVGLGILGGIAGFWIRVRDVLRD